MAFPISQCRSCHASIIWGVTANEKLIPVDSEPTADGNVLLFENRNAVVLGPLEVSIHNREIEPLRLPHHATCPDAEMWKRS